MSLFSILRCAFLTFSQVFSWACLLHTPIEPDPVISMQQWPTKHFSKLQPNSLVTIRFKPRIISAQIQRQAAN